MDRAKISVGVLGGIFSLFLLLPFCSVAAEEDRSEAEKNLPVLAPVTVIGTFAHPATGRSVVDGKMIRNLPAGNGSIEEILRFLPDVQTAETFRTSADAAEILPPAISISGGKTYQNNFRIDGLRNDSILDPTETDFKAVNSVPGHPQALLLDASLVERLTVYDSNVPARHGAFTGGVIEVETVEPKAEFAGEISYRTTRADWTRFHLRAEEKEPSDFEKHQGGANLHIPLGAGTGLFTSYRQIYSRVPVRHIGEPNSRSRRKDDYFLKLRSPLPDGQVDLSFAATPYEAKEFLPLAKNSDILIKQGGWQVQGNSQHDLPAGELRLQAGYQESTNRRDAPADFLAWGITHTRPWGVDAQTGTSNEGGFGDIERKQESITVRTAIDLAPFRTGGLSHIPEAGVELETIRGTYHRKETTRVYSGAVVDGNVICGEDTVACIDEDQYFSQRTSHQAAFVEARVNLADLYLQDEVTVGRLLLRPGVRLSYDDFMGNFNVAPRFATSYDLFGNGRTVVLAGLNRYYGRTLLAYKLKERQPLGFTEYRGMENQNFPGAWEIAPAPLQKDFRFSPLDTPYSDELTAGVDQAFAGGRLSLRYVHRDNRDEFARQEGILGPDGVQPSFLTNGGKSRHDSVRLSWERSWGRDLLSLNVSWQQTTASNETIDQILLDEEDVEDRVWYQGRIIPKHRLPRADYNRPWTAHLTYVGEFPYGLSFTNVTRYRSGYRGPVRVGSRSVPTEEMRTNPVTGEPIAESLSAYEEKKLSGGVVFDWVLRWQSPGDKRLLLAIEINNVFDARLESGNTATAYEVGRQFWASAGYRF